MGKLTEAAIRRLTDADSYKLNEYRCTRNAPYMHDCIGRDDIGARQGHYIHAVSPEAAVIQMKEEFPDDRDGFTVELFQQSWGCAVCNKSRVLCRCSSGVLPCL